MAAKIFCRFCLKEEQVKRAILIFSSTNSKKLSLLEYTFDVTIRDDDGKSKYSCRNCFSTATNTHKKLQKLREMAHKSYKESNVDSDASEDTSLA